MLRIALTDDHQSARDDLRLTLEKYLIDPAESITYEFRTGATTVNWITAHPGEIDLLFLDIEMPGISGMEAAARIREADKDILLVFVTGYPDYVFDGYQTGALDYLIKPASDEKIRAILKRAREILYRKHEKYFIFHNQEGTYRMAMDRILYLYSDRRQVVLVTDRNECTFYAKLSDVEERLDQRFVRIHQRYLVNADHVDYIGHEELRIGEKIIPISRSLRDQAVKRLAEHMLRGTGM